MEKITIIVPCYNEEEVIDMFYSAVQKQVEKISGCEFDYIFVNDGSRDSTLEKLREISRRHDNVSYLSLSRNFGKESAMMAGLDYAEGDAVIIMDADLQHPPEKISEMVTWWRAGYDDICARRVDRSGETWFKKTAANIFYGFMKKFSTSNEIQRNVGDFRLLDKRCVEALKIMRENQRFTKGLFAWVGYRKKIIPFEVQPRAAGSTNWNYAALFSLAIKGMTSFTTAPLHFVTFLGITISCGAIGYMIFVLIMALLYGDPVAGYPTLMTVILFLGGTQLLAIGIIGEYLSQIFHETKHRPIYLIDEHNGQRMIYKSVLIPAERNFENQKPAEKNNP